MALDTMERMEWDECANEHYINDKILDCLFDTDIVPCSNSQQEVTASSTLVKTQDSDNETRESKENASMNLIPASSWAPNTSCLYSWQQKPAKQESVRELNSGLTQDARLHLCCMFFKQKTAKQKPAMEEMVFLKPRFLAWCKDQETLLVEGSNVIRTVPTSGDKVVSDENVTEDIVATFNQVVKRWEMVKGKTTGNVGLIAVNWTFIVSLVYVACPRIYAKLPNVLERSRRFNHEHFKRKANMIHDDKHDRIDIKANPYIKETSLWIEFSFRDPNNSVHNSDPENPENRTLFVVHRDERYAYDDPRGLLVVEDVEGDSPYVVLGDPVELVKLVVRYSLIACVSCVEFNGATGEIPVFTLRYGTYDQGSGIPSVLGDCNLSLNDPFLLDIDKSYVHYRAGNYIKKDILYEKLTVLGNHVIERFEFDFKSISKLWAPEHLIRQRILDSSSSCIPKNK